MKTQIQKSFSLIASVACLWFALLAQNVSAIVLYWNPNGTSSIGGNDPWNTNNLYWSTVYTQSGSLIAWPSTGTLGGTNCAACFCAGPSGSANQGSFTATLTNPITIAGIFNGQLNPGPCNITINGTGSGSLNLLNALCAFDTYNGLTVVNVPITGPGVVGPESTGTNELNGTNTFTGGVALGNNQGTPSYTGVLAYNNNQSFGTGAIGLTNTGGGICALVAEAGADGLIISNAFKITPAAGGLNLAVSDPLAGVTFSGTWTLTSNLNIGTGGVAQSNVITISGVMSGAGALNKFNPNTLRLSGANTYTGNTSISNGTLQLGAAGGIPSGSGKGNVTIAAGVGAVAILDVNGFSGGVNGLSGNGMIDNTSATAGALSIGGNNIGGTYTGVITNSGGGALSITKTGTATFVLSNSTNGYSGNTTINAGTFQLAASNSIPSNSPVVVSNGAILNMGGFSDTFAALSGGGTITNNSGTITLIGNSTPSNFAGYSCFFGAIDKGTVTKTGSNVMSLRQTNFAGTNVNFNYLGGVLSVGAGSNRLSTNYALTVPSGGLFQLDANSQTVSSLNGSGAINLGGGTLTVNATNGSFYTGTIQNSELPGSPTDAGHGLRGYYYSNIDMSGLVTVRDDATIDFTNLALPVNLPSPPYPKTNYNSIRWLGQIQTTIAGTYTFTTTTDDGARLWVNGTNVVDNWISESATSRSGSITLAANTRYDIVMEYMNLTGGATATLAWTLPGDSVSAIIPTDFLYLPGPGSLVIGGTSQVTLSGSNTFTGGTTILNGGTVQVTADNTLGQGNVYVSNNANLTLGGGVTNGYISSSGDLVINGLGALVVLSYSGTDTIHGFSTNGGVTYLTPGIYGAQGSSAPAQNQIYQFIGSGLLNVTASPSSVSLTSSGGAVPYGSSITFTSTVSGSGPTPTGTITFYDGISAIGSAPLSAGTATFTLSYLQVATSPHSITAVYSGDPNYVQSTSSALTETITPLTVSPVTLVVSNKVYDTTASASIIASNCTLSGVLPADVGSVSVGSATATFANKTVGTNKTVTITNITLAGSLAGNYVLSPNSGSTTANITSVGLTITNVFGTSITYNGTTVDPLNTVSTTLVGAYPDDIVFLNISAAIGNFATATVGTGKAVTVTGFVLNGSDAPNYTLAQPTGLTGSITQSSTTNVIGSSSNPSFLGGSVNFTSTPTPIAPGGGIPTGSVIFLTNGVAFSTNVLSGGVATSATTTSLPAGTNTITAQYAGDVNFTGNNGTFKQVVSASSPPGALSISLAGTNVVLNWSGSFTLQSAPAVKGTNSGFSDVPGPVLTGPYTNTNGAADLFFRLRN